MEESGARRAYQQRSLILAICLLTALLICTIVIVAGVQELDRYGFFRFPLGFYLVGQALLLAMAGGAFWFARVQQRLDEELSESEEF